MSNLFKNPELKWNDLERRELESRIISLRDDQIGALLNLVGLNFHKEDIEEIVVEIKKDKNQSIHLDVLMTEANSKKDLLWWLSYFERYNK